MLISMLPPSREAASLTGAHPSPAGPRRRGERAPRTGPAPAERNRRRRRNASAGRSSTPPEHQESAGLQLRIQILARVPDVRQLGGAQMLKLRKEIYIFLRRCN